MIRLNEGNFSVSWQMMADLNSMVVFAKVVEAKSFSEAARRLKMPTSSVSRHVAELEDRLGVRLLERSTRSLRLTELGAEIFEYAMRSAELSDAVENLVSNRLAEVAGTLRISAPPNVTETLLTPLICAFQQKYPNVRVQTLITDRHVDHIAEGIELAIRLGPLKDSSLVANRMLTYRHQLVASPTYLSSHNPPKEPNDLHDHRLISFLYWNAQNTWTLVHKNGKDRQTVTFEPYLSMNDFHGLASVLVAGGGIGELPPVVQPALIREGRLVEVMPDWRFGTYDLSLVHLGSRHISKPCRLFKELARQMAPTLFPRLPT
jgi:DNA-binding transcriptional LysR family regulator